MSDRARAILADLDGIFFHLVDHFGEYGVSARRIEEVAIVDGLGDVLGALAEIGFTILGHTNQPDIAHEKITQEFLDGKHALLREKYPQIQKVFVCPHTETDLCACRKLKPGLLRQAGREFGIDFSRSWVIGDSRSDIEAGCLVYAKTIFVQTKYNCGDPAIDKCTAIARSPRAALSLIRALENKTINTEDA